MCSLSPIVPSYEVRYRAKMLAGLDVKEAEDGKQ
jgi:hypothetical protein